MELVRLAVGLAVRLAQETCTGDSHMRLAVGLAVGLAVRLAVRLAVGLANETCT